MTESGSERTFRPWNSGGQLACRSAVRWGGGLHEVRTVLARNRIARVLFYVDVRVRMVLLHGFIKKTRETPKDDLDLALRNLRKHRGGLQ